MIIHLGSVGAQLPDARQIRQARTDRDKYWRTLGQPAEAFIAKVSVDEHRFEAGAQSNARWWLALATRLVNATPWQVHDDVGVACR